MQVIIRRNIRPLLHETAPIMPETVMKGENVLELLGLIHTRMRVLPLIRGQSEIG